MNLKSKYRPHLLVRRKYLSTTGAFTTKRTAKVLHSFNFLCKSWGFKSPDRCGVPVSTRLSLWFYSLSLLRGPCGGGAPSTGAELGTDSSWPACMRSLTRSWQPSCSMRKAILAMLRESSRPLWGRPSYFRPKFSSMVLSFVCVRGTWRRKTAGWLFSDWIL